MTGDESKYPAWEKSPTTARLEAADHYLYRAFNSDGNLLYVGRAINVDARFKAHKQTSGWYRQMAYRTIEGPFSYADIKRVELDAIYAEDPPWNAQGSRRSRIEAATRTASYALHIEATVQGWNIMDMAEILGRADRLAGIMNMRSLEPSDENVSVVEYRCGLLVEIPGCWLERAERELRSCGWTPTAEPDALSIARGERDSYQMIGAYCEFMSDPSERI